MNDSNIAIDTTLCLACGNCVDRCIMDNLRLSLPPCRQASPLGVNYQGVARLLASGKEEDAAQYSPLVLAYMGDAVYELMIRTLVVNQGNAQVNKLHKRSAGLVKAEAQARMALALQEDLTETERAVYRRGRNAKSYTSAKNASIRDYRTATGFEALAGYLYLSGQPERLAELVRLGLMKLGEVSLAGQEQEPDGNREPKQNQELGKDRELGQEQEPLDLR